MRIVIASVLAAVLLMGCANTPESVIPYSEIPETGDVARGEALYNESISLAPTCASCHNAEGGGSPDLTGYGEIAGTRVEGQDAHEYTFYSIAEPWRYIVDGYGNAMYNLYDDRLTPQQIADLIAYVLSL